MRSFSLDLPVKRSQVHLTSLAVNGLPSCHLTPWRSVKLSSFPSSLHDQRRELRHDCLQAVLRHVLVVERRLLNTPIIGIEVDNVASSRIDMLAGLSRW